MMLRTSRIIDLLRNKRGRYIHHDAAAFRMKEANGEDVMLMEDRRGYLVEPTAQQIDDLMDAKRLVRDGQIRLAPEPPTAAWADLVALCPQGRGR